MKHKVHVKFHSEALLEELEARQLFSGGIEGILADNNEPEAAVHMEVIAEAELIESPDSIAASTTELIRQELVFIDTDVDNYQELLNDIINQSDEERSIEVILLGNQRDGIEQITETLADFQNLDAVHLISHGSDGSIDIGNTTLDENTLNQSLMEISDWGDAFTEEGDFLIYGCNLAETEEGQSLVDSLSHLTHTDVAASDDLTGAAALGGDWELEYNSGSIESDIAISAEAQQQWNAVLAETIYESYNTVTAPTELKSSIPSGQTFTHTSDNGTYDVNQISLQLIKDVDAASQNITVTLRDTWNGSILGTATISSDTLTTSYANYDFGFSDVTLTDGTTYYIQAITNSLLGKVYVGSDGSGTYANGAQLDKDGDVIIGKDLAFSIKQVTATETIADQFDQVSYNNSDGTQAWTGDWVETADDGSAGTGDIRIESNQLHIDDVGDGGAGGGSISRAFDLTGATTATLSFDYDANGSGGVDTMAIEVSSDGGATWTTLESIDVVGAISGTKTYTLESHGSLTNDMEVRFNIVTGFGGAGQYFKADNVQIEYSTAALTPIAHWTFDTDATDSSGNNYDGTLIDNAFIDTTDGTDKIGAAKLSLDGTGDVVDLSAHVASFSGLTEGTISAWVNVASGDTSFNAIFDISDGAGVSEYLTLFVNNGKLILSTGTGGSIDIELSSTTSINDGNWHHVAFSSSAGNAIYLDGIQLTEALGTLAYNNGDKDSSSFFADLSSLNSVSIGASNLGVIAGEFNGLIDDVRLYDNALTASQISELSNTAPVAGNDTASTDEDSVLNVAAPGVLGNDTDEDVVTLSPTAGSTMSFDAANDSDGDWLDDDATARTWTMDAFGTEVTHTTSLAKPLPGITAAYRFSGAVPSGATMGSFEDLTGNPTDTSASFELWFRPDVLTGQQILFETGGSTDGTSIYLDGSNLIFVAKDGAVLDQVSVDLSSLYADPTAEFIQLVAVIDMTGNHIELFIDGVSQAQASLNGLDWAGAGGSGLGQVNAGTAAGSGQFDGDIAIFRFYEQALTATEVGDNYQAVTASGDTLTVSKVEGSAGDVGNQISLASGALLTMNADGSYSYDPNGQFESLGAGDSTTDSFSYTVTDGIATDTATVTVTVNGVNDAPVITSSNAVNVTENQTTVLTVTASDAEADTPSFSISGGADAALFIIDSSTGNLSFITAPDFETPIDVGADNIYEVTVQADDGNSGTDSQTISVTVTNQNDVVLDATSSVETANSSVTISHTTSGDNRLMLVGISMHTDNGTVTSIDYNGTALTLVGVQEDAGGKARIEIWSLLAPDTGTYDLNVSFSGSRSAIVGVQTFTNVDQTIALGAFASAEGSSDYASLSGITSSEGDLVFGVVDHHKGTSLTPDPGQTEYWNFVGDNTVGGATLENGSTTVDLGWSLSNIEKWAVGAVSINVYENGVYNQVPIDQITDEDTTLLFNTANNNLISITQSDAGVSAIEATISVDNGVLNLSGTTGLTVVAGSNNSSTMTVQGTLADLNAALDGLTYTTPAEYNGTDTLTINTLNSTLLSLNIDANLAGYYSFDNTADLGDDSSVAGTFDGAVVGATSTIDATHGEVLSLDGNDHVEISGHLTNPTSVTLSAWVDLSVADISGADVISLGDSVVLRLDSDGKIKGIYHDGSSYQFAETTLSLAGTGWHHVAYTIDDATHTHTLYVDGVEVASVVETTSVDYTKGANTYIGTHGNGSTTYDFNGNIDDVRIYDKALTAQEIASLADSLQLQASDTVAITVTAINDIAVITSSAGTVAYIEQANATVIDSAITLTDIDGFNNADPSDQYTATVQVTGNYEAADILGFSDTSKIQGSLVGDQLTLSVIGGQTATIAEFEAALQSVTFYSNSDDPITLDKTISFTFDDGVDSSNTGTKLVQVTAVNDAPILSINNSNLLYASGALEIDNALSVSDIDSTHLESATIWFTTGYLPSEDTLVFVNQNDITGSFVNGVLTLTGTATVADYQTALSSVQYEDIADPVTKGLLYISMSVNDGTANSNVDTRIIELIDGGNPRAGDDSGTVLEGQSIILDLAANDADDVSLDLNSITITSAASNGSVVVNGDGTVTYTHDGSETLSDSFMYTITDGALTSNVATVNLTVTPVNDAPVLTNGSNGTANEGNAYAAFNGASLSDADSADFNTGTLTFSIASGSDSKETLFLSTFGGVSTSGSDVLVNGVLVGSFSGGTSGSDLVITLSNDATVARVQNVYQALAIGAINGEQDPTTGVRTLEAVLTDGDGATSNTATASVTINAVNDAPSGADKTVITNEDTDYAFKVVDFGFTDVESDALLNVIIASAPSNGTLYLDSNADGIIDDGEALAANAVVAVADITAGQLKFQPASDANGTGYDSFTFQVQDDGGVANTGIDIDQSANTITINVTAVSDAAIIAGTDTGAVQEDISVNTNNISTTGTLSITDVDTGEASFTAETITGSYGDLSINTSGDWTYTADNTQAVIQALDSGEFLTDTLQISSVDGTTHNVVLTINGSDDLAVIGGTTTGSVTEDGTLTTTAALTITDTDTSDSTDFVDVVATASDNGYGTFEITSNSWTFTLDNTHADVQALDVLETLTDTYTFTAPDGVAQQVTVTIHGAEDTPIFDTAGIITATEDSAYSYNITTSDVDIEAVTITATTLPTWLTLTDNGDGTASLTGTPTNAEVGNHSVVLNVNDGEVNSNQSFSIAVANTNDAAIIAGTDTGAVQEDISVNTNNISTTGTLSITDVDTGEASFTAETITGSYGDLSINTSGDWTYTADNTQAVIQALDSGEFLTDTLQISSVDGTTHNVVLTINGSDDLAVIGGTTTGSVTEDGTLTTTAALTITDTDTSDSTDFVDVVATASDNGYGTFEITSNSWTFTLDNTHADVQALDVLETLTDTYTFTAPDGVAQQVTVTIHGAEDTPIFDTAGIITATEDSAYSYNITTSDVDIEAVTITATTLPTWLTLTDNGDGTASLTGTPTNAEVGNHSVVLNVNDGEVNSNQSFSIAVANTNDLPIAVNDVAVTSEDVALNNINVLSNDTDIDGDILSVTLANALNGSVAINGNGTLNYTPNSNFNGVDIISYTISDGKGGEASSTVNLTVTAVNDNPIAVADSGTTNEDVALNNINVLSNDIDSDGGLLSVTLATALNGSVDINVDGTLNYRPNNDFNGIDTISYTVSDSQGGSAIGTVHLTVTAVNDIPVVNSDAKIINVDGVLNNISVLGDGNDADGDSLSVNAASALNGVVSINTDGSLNYRPDSGYQGSDTITYEIIDTYGATATGVVNLVVTPSSDVSLGVVLDDLKVDDNKIVNEVVGIESDSDEGLLGTTYMDNDLGIREIDKETFDPIKNKQKTVVDIILDDLGGSGDEKANDDEESSRNSIKALSGTEYFKPKTDIEKWAELQLQSIDDGSLLMDNSYDSFSITDSKENAELRENIKLMAEQMYADAEQLERKDIEIEIVAGATIGLTAGVVNWVLRGGALLSSLLSSASLFKQFDPLAVVFSTDKADKGKSKEDELDKENDVEKLFDNKNKK